MSTVIIGGAVENLPISSLDLDWMNPRLPSEMQNPDVSQDDLALYIDLRFEPVRVAQSISRHGFFASEPLIAVRDGNRYTVVEGNRRLTALRGLTDLDLRERLLAQTRGWRDTDVLPSDLSVPVLLIEERSQIDALLGFRHISGIEPWDPFAQARFIARLVDENDGDFPLVAERVGRDLSEVRAMYRDFDIVNQAKSQFGLDTTKVESAFGVFNAAMSVVNLRNYIGAPTPRSVNPEFFPLPEDRGEKVRNLFTYIYGDERGKNRVVSDSRQLRDLGKVLADPRGAGEKTLRQTLDLDQALEATADPDQRSKRELGKAHRALLEAKNHLQDGDIGETIRDLTIRCREALEALETAIDGTSK